MPSRTERSTLLHPASGLLILVVDWLLFSGGVLALGVSTPALLLLGGLLVTVAVATLQHRYADDGRGMGWLKGVAGGIAVSLPLPVAGTGLGGLVLALSGLNRLRGRSSADASADRE